MPSVEPIPPGSPDRLSTGRRVAFSVIALLLSLVLIVACAEIMVHLFSPQNLSGSWRVQSERWGYLMNKAGGKARHQFEDRVVSYRFNSLHLRGGEIESNVPKVLVLGDSYTFGSLVEEQDTYVAVLQEYADREFGPGKVQFLNGGAGGWGTADYLAFLEEFGKKLSPRVVLVFMNSDDVGRSIKSGLYTLKDTDTLELESHSKPISSTKRTLNALPFYQWLLEHSHLVQFLRKTYLIRLQSAAAKKDGDRQEGIVRPHSKTLQVDPALSRALGRALFRRLNDWCRGHDARLLVTTPGYHFRLVGREREPTAAFLQTAESIFEQEGIPYWDTTPEMFSAIKEEPDDFIIMGEGHPNERAHRVIARVVWPWLRPQIATILDLPGTEAR